MHDIHLTQHIKTLKMNSEPPGTYGAPDSITATFVQWPIGLAKKNSNFFLPPFKVKIVPHSVFA
jgi:hypothetical protein